MYLYLIEFRKKSSLQGLRTWSLNSNYDPRIRLLYGVQLFEVPPALKPNTSQFAYQHGEWVSNDS
jgi:hypothetical protein